MKDEAWSQGKRQALDQIERLLDAMRASLPGLLHVWIGINQSDSADAADLVLYSDFESWEALQFYDAHPLHQELRGIIAPLRCERRVIDFEVEG
jgi:hypothetical protein